MKLKVIWFILVEIIIKNKNYFNYNSLFYYLYNKLYKYNYCVKAIILHICYNFNF